MLSLMRKHAGSWMIKVVLFIIVVVFVFWGFGSMRSRNASVVAEINGEVITLETYRRAYYQMLDSYQRIYGAQLNDEMLELLRLNEMALEQLIQRYLMSQEAERLEIEVDEVELRDSIQRIPAFQNNGAFDYQRYLDVLAQNSISTEQFESDHANDMRQERLRAVVLSGIAVTEEEARQWYKKSNAQVDLEYVFFAPTRYKDIQPADDEVAAYFKSNEKSYLTRPEVRVRYLHFSVEAYKDKIEISDEQVSDYYHGHPDEFESGQSLEAAFDKIHGRLTDEGAKSLALDKAEEVYNTVYDGDDLADAGTAHGMLAQTTPFFAAEGFRHKGISQPRKFAQVAFSLEQMAISEIQDFGDGYYLLQVVERSEPAVPEFDQVAEKAKADLIKSLQDRKAKAEAELFLAEAKKEDSLSAAGAALGVKPLTTGLFGRNLDIPGIGYDAQMSAAAFTLTEDKPLLEEAQKGPQGWYVLRLKERRLPAEEDFAKEKAAIGQRLGEQKKQAAVRAWLADLRARGKVETNASLIEP